MAWQPKLSIIVPVCRAGEYLEGCLESLIDQTLVEAEIICVDDCLPLEDLSIIEAFTGKYQQVRYTRHKEPCGREAAINTGLALAEGKYVGIADPNCWYDPVAYFSLVIEAEATGVDIARCGFTACYPNSSEIWRSAPCKEPFYVDEAMDVACGFLRQKGGYVGADLMEAPNEAFRIWQFPALAACHPALWSTIYRRDFLTENKIRMEKTPGVSYNDLPFLIETLCHAEKIAVVKDSLVYWRVQPLTDDGYMAEIAQGCQHAVRIMYQNQMTDIMGEALAAHIVVKNRAYYNRAQGYQKEMYGARLKDLLKWIHCEQIPLGMENQYLSEQDCEFMAQFIEI